MYKLKYAEFYITNVCNLACDGCNRFNNFPFTGSQRWRDYKHLYEQWADKVTFTMASILGGEPLSNPDFLDWMHGVAGLWPTVPIRVITNGTQMHRWPDLYEQLKPYQGRVFLEINEHDENKILLTMSKIESWLQGPVDKTVRLAIDLWRAWASIRAPGWPDCETHEDFAGLPDHIRQECETVHGFYWWKFIRDITYVDANGVTIEFTPAVLFYESPLIFDPATHHMQLHRNDPQEALKACYWKSCHHFVRGKLYKCGVTALLPEFIQQFDVDITQQERDIINGYRPGEVDQNLDAFMRGLIDMDVVPHCGFCPTDTISTQLLPARKKKHKVIKINNVSVV